jgi:tetratricopeptide (TPR) repeat protein
MGNCLMELGHADQAEGRYRMALLLGPPSADLHFSLGYALFKQNKLKEAVSALDAALKLEPRHAAAAKLKEQILR